MQLLTLFLPFIAFFSGYIGIIMYTHTKTIKVPSVVGKSLHNAVSLLGKHNLGLKLLTVKEDACLPEGTIISQAPRQNQQIKLAKAVFVVMTKKPQPFLVPTFFGKSSKEIFDVLKDSYVTIKLVRLESSYRKDCCFAQYPNQGRQAFDGKAIAYISSGVVDRRIMPSLIGYTLDEVEEFLQRYEIVFEVFKFFTAPSSFGGLIVSDQKPMPGTIINFDKTLHVQLKVDFQ